MKLFHTIATAAMLFIASTAAFAQPSVSLSLNNTSIERALDRIEDQSGYNFLIADKSLDLSKRVDVSADNKPLTQVLDQLFAGTNIVYRIEDRQIILSPRPAGSTSSESGAYNLRGTIIDSNGEPIVGAYIVNKDTGKGTMSDNNGGYSLVVSPGATVEISFLGWCWFGALFSLAGAAVFRGRRSGKTPGAFSVLRRNWFPLAALALCFGAMQFATNLVFDELPVGPALALFQLSAAVNLWFGWRFFRERDMKKKILGTIVTMIGAGLIILFC